ncbi:MAG: hypothetical protein WC901_07645 [Candidatus Margulisiibacteriota bacterium]
MQSHRLLLSIFSLFCLLTMVLGFSFSPKPMATSDAISSVKTTAPAATRAVSAPPVSMIRITGSVRAVGNEPFVEIVLQDKSGTPFHLVGDSRLHLTDLQGQTITAYGSLIKNTSRYVRKTLKVERYAVGK